jgi:hypothetical protein
VVVLSESGQGAGSVELTFSTRVLRDLCEDEDRAAKVLPPDALLELQDRLADIDAADTVDDLVFGGPEIDRRSPGYVRFRLGGGYELMCRNNSRAVVLTADDEVNTGRIRRLRVIKIGGEDS